MLKVSLITVSFNSAATIADAIQSVLQQTYPDIEYIIVDGKSTDTTVDIIKKYEPMFGGRLVWVSEPDGGLYDAMNKGIRMAGGDIIGIINSDDFYHRSDIIAQVVECFSENSDVEATYGDVRFVHPVDTDRTMRYYPAKNFNPGRFRFGFMPPHPSFFTYKRNFEKYGYYQTDYYIAADYELLIRFLYTNGLKSQYLPLDVMKMRTGGRSTASLKSNLILNREIVRACRENGIRTNLLLLSLKYFIKILELIRLKK